MKNNKKNFLFRISLLIISVSLILCGCETAPETLGTTSPVTSAVSTEPKEYTKVGVATVCTNPPEGIDMSGFTLTGFGNIDRKFEGIHDDLEIGCTAFDINGTKSAIIVSDTLGWDKDLTDELRYKVEKELGIPADALLFNASHTHSAFNTLTNTLGLGRLVPEYKDFFYEAAFDCIKAAFEDLEDAEIYTGVTTASEVNISRRKIVNGKCSWAPSAKDPSSDETTVMKVVCGDKIKAVLFCFACHPSTLNGSYASADYVGPAREYIEEEFEGATAMFIQGCGGDQKTYNLNPGGGSFKYGTFDDIERLGDRLGTAVVKLCKATNDRMKKLEGDISAEMVRFEIPLQENTKTKADYERLMKTSTGVLVEVYTWFYENYENLPTSKPYSVQRIDFGSDFTVFALEGEVVVEYDKLFKDLLPDRQVMVAGYSNGEIGYICMTHMYDEGGYEPITSCDYYGIPQGFVPEIQSIIMDNAKTLVD